MNAIISIEKLYKTYFMGKQSVQVLKGLSLNIFKNEYVALMGPSGSGKSTLMNIIGCLDTPTGGKYVLNNKDVSKMTDDSLAEVRNKEIGRTRLGVGLPEVNNLPDAALNNSASSRRFHLWFRPPRRGVSAWKDFVHHNCSE